ncbi:hypothetical protein [Streptomyces chilikensis]|uniref:Tat pathway signal protein n=1 Tax=Streptomyces chilikensis TaxID=1194079 RepID=A0ABV3EN47_9ACTN
MSYGQGGPGPQQWDPWTPQSQQPNAVAPEPWSQGGSGGPDWDALAEASAAKAKRRRIVAAGAAAAVVAAGAVTAVLLTRGGEEPSTAGGSGGASASTGTPSFAPTSAPPPLDPEEILADSRKDTAPLSPATLLPGKAGGKLTLGQAVYVKGPSAETADCASAAQHTLPAVLNANGCTKMLRATYTRDGVAVTVGVAVFDTAGDATAARGQADKAAIIEPLSGKGVKPFCDGAVCRTTMNSYGRYAYFTITGFTGGKDVTAQDKKAFDAGDQLAHYTFQQIHRRGEVQSTAAPAS